MNQIGLGSWVYTSKAGVWQIYRVETFVGLDPITENEIEQTVFFAKRFLNDSLKKSFTEACFTEDYLTPLAPQDVKELDQYINDNQRVYRLFQEYEPKPIDSLFNARIAVPAIKCTSELLSMIPSDQLLKASEIKPFIHALGFETQGFPTWTLQFVSPGFSVANGFLVYKFSTVLEF